MSIEEMVRRHESAPAPNTERLIAALKAIVEAGRMSDQPRAVYCADIAHAALEEAAK